jgi:hypothetical protein
MLQLFMATPPKRDVGGRTSAAGVLDTLVAQRAQIDAAEQVLAGTEQHGRDGQVQLPGGANQKTS